MQYGRVEKQELVTACDRSHLGGVKLCNKVLTPKVGIKYPKRGLKPDDHSHGFSREKRPEYGNLMGEVGKGKKKRRDKRSNLVVNFENHRCR